MNFTRNTFEPYSFFVCSKFVNYKAKFGEVFLSKKRPCRNQIVLEQQQQNCMHATLNLSTCADRTTNTKIMFGGINRGGGKENCSPIFSVLFMSVSHQNCISRNLY